MNGVEFLVTEVLMKGMIWMEGRGKRLRGCVILVSRLNWDRVRLMGQLGGGGFESRGKYKHKMTCWQDNTGEVLTGFGTLVTEGNVYGSGQVRGGFSINDAEVGESD